MAFTAKILSWRFRHLNIVGCLLKRKPNKGGSRAPQDSPPSYAPDVRSHIRIRRGCSILILSARKMHIIRIHQPPPPPPTSARVRTGETWVYHQFWSIPCFFLIDSRRASFRVWWFFNWPLWMFSCEIIVITGPKSLLWLRVEGLNNKEGRCERTA